jgi:hypothetical protein
MEVLDQLIEPDESDRSKRRRTQKEKEDDCEIIRSVLAKSDDETLSRQFERNSLEDSPDDSKGEEAENPAEIGELEEEWEDFTVESERYCCRCNSGDVLQ